MYTRESHQLQRILHGVGVYCTTSAPRMNFSPDESCEADFSCRACKVFCEHKGVVMVSSRLVLAALLLIFSVSVVNAYTVVIRDGRRIEIPNEFTVTNSTLTYFVGNGFQITIQLNTVDIAATERANGGSEG